MGIFRFVKKGLKRKKPRFSVLHPWAEDAITFKAFAAEEGMDQVSFFHALLANYFEKQKLELQLKEIEVEIAKRDLKSDFLVSHLTAYEERYGKIKLTPEERSQAVTRRYNAMVRDMKIQQSLSDRLKNIHHTNRS